MRIDRGCAAALAILALLAAGIVWCGYYLVSTTNREAQEVEAVIQTWLDRYNHEDFVTCYRSSDASLRALATVEEYRENLSLMFAKSGPVTLVERRGFYVNTNNSIITATEQWESHSQLGSVNAVITLRKTDRWRIAAFMLRP